jgi:branched-chain amino acid transport system substrate-binding protein
VGTRRAAVAATFVTAMCVALAFMLGCGPDEDARAIRVGVGLPLTGSASVLGEQMRMGAGLAMVQRNARGGINGRPIELVYGDDRGRATEAAKVAHRFADDPTVVAVIGHFNSACSLAGKPIYAEAGLLQFSPGSTNVDVCRGSDWTFRNLYSDDYQGRSIARYIWETLGLRRAAVLYDDDDYGVGLKDAFAAEAATLGLEIVGSYPYEREVTLDFGPDIDQSHELGAEIIFVSGLYNEAALIAREARDKGIETPFIGGDAVLSEALLGVGGEAVEGMLMTTPFIVHPDIGGAEAQAFAEAFSDAYERTPDTWAALSYDAVNQLLDTIKEEGTDRTRIRDHFARTTTPERAYNGVTGATYFDENGDCLKPAYVAVVRNDEFVPAARQLVGP